MANIATVLRSEIARVARKEVRAEIEILKKASTQHRSAVAQQRRQATASRHGTPGAAPDASGNTPRRLSAIRLAAHRAKLDLSAAAYGKLVGMSGATIFLWERGRSRPNAEQLQRLAALRALGKRAVLEPLDPAS